jgi:hypothetical protein
VRHLVAAGGLATAVCSTWLLFSGAAAARSAADAVTVEGLAYVDQGSTTIKFTVTDSGLGQIDFHGGSNWHFTSMSAGGAFCNLTPTDGGGECSFPYPLSTDFAVYATISAAQPPSVVAGSVVYADTSTGEFTAPVTASSGKPFITQAYLRGVTARRPDLGFTVNEGPDFSPKIASFRVLLPPHGLTFDAKSIGRDHGSGFVPHARCTFNSPRRVTCKGTSPESTFKAAFTSSALVESKALENAVKHYKVLALSFPIEITDVKGTATSRNEKIPLLNTFHITSAGVFQAHFLVPASRNLSRPGILMRLYGDPNGTDMDTHPCTVHLLGTTTSAWPSGQGSDVTVGIRWPPMASPATATVTCRYAASGIQGAQLLFESAGRPTKVVTLTQI